MHCHTAGLCKSLSVHWITRLHLGVWCIHEVFMTVSTAVDLLVAFLYGKRILSVQMFFKHLFKNRCWISEQVIWQLLFFFSSLLCFSEGWIYLLCCFSFYTLLQWTNPLLVANCSTLLSSSSAILTQDGFGGSAQVSQLQQKHTYRVSSF